jgi:hypothetical protein
VAAETYFALWAALMPMTTLLVVPSFQGTTPAYLLAFISLSACAFSRKSLTFMSLAGGCWIAFIAFSQFGLMRGAVTDFGQLNLIEPNDHDMVFRKTTLTQTLYLIACLATFVYVRQYFRESWLRYVFFGAWLLVLYGLYEWVAFALFGTTADFLGNREFEAGANTHTGSWSQTAQVGPFLLLRLKSFTGEPSFFALVAIPYLALALTHGRKRLAAALFLCLLLSLSTSAYLGILAIAVFTSFQNRSIDRRVFAAIVVGAVVFCVLFFAFPDTYAAMFTHKFAGENESGASRMFHMTYPFKYFVQLPVVNQLFGVGFGTTYLAGTMRVLLDLGVFGLCLYLAFFLRPVLQLSKSREDIGCKTAIRSILLLYTVSAAELFYPTTWLILGIAYARLRHGKVAIGTADRMEQRPAGVRDFALPRVACQ